MEPLYPYQEYAINKVVAQKRTAVWAPPGAGKTRIVIEALRLLEVLPGGKNLFMCSGPAVRTWEWQLPKWCPELDPNNIIVVTGSAKKRAELWKQVKDGKCAIINYSVFLRDYDIINRIMWDSVVTDEYHKVMRRRQSKTFKCFRSMTRKIKHVVMATGSIMTKDPSSMWTTFTIAQPELWASYWKFVNTYCVVDDGMFGKEILGPKNTASLKERIDRTFAYIPEAVVASQLPEGVRNSVHLQMTSEQAKVYRKILEDMIYSTDQGELKLITSNVLHQLIVLRKLLCCPRLVDPELGIGAGLEYILDSLEGSDDGHCIIFVPFREACDIVRDVLLERGGYGEGEVFIYRGGMERDEQKMVIEGFKSIRGVLICTIASAESFDAETCAKSWFLGYGFTVDENRQAEGRTRRAISEHKFVTWTYLRYDDTIDEHFLDVLNAEHRSIKAVLDRPEDLIKALTKGL